MSASRRPLVRLFHWRPVEARGLIERLRRAGFEVLYKEETQSPSVRELRDSGVAAIVIDLSRLPSHGRYVGAWVRGSKSIRRLPLVFAGGEPDKVAAIHREMPDAVYTSLAALPESIKKAIAHPLKDPVVPRQMMESDPARTTAQKLGIAENSAVGLIDAPRDYARVVGPLPKGAFFAEDPGGQACPVTLWFVHDAHEFESALSVLRRLVSKTRLWIAWPKGRSDGLNGNFIRQAAQGVGLVDYKICRLNETWSSMALTLKRPRS
jgi:hypothetical protein